MLSPCSADTGDRGEVVDAEPADERTDVADDAVEDLLRPVDEVHLVDREDEVADAERRRDDEMRAGLLEEARRRASTSTTARSAVDAPVAMLRVYCAWPGLSPMMNERVGVAK